MLWQFASIPQRDALLWTLRVISRIRDGFHHLDTLTTRVAILDITGVSPSDAQHLRMADILGVLRRARDESRDQILGRCDLVQLWAELRYRVAAPRETLPVSEREWKMLPTYLHSATPNKLSSYQLFIERAREVEARRHEKEKERPLGDLQRQKHTLVTRLRTMKGTLEATVKENDELRKKIELLRRQRTQKEAERRTSARISITFLRRNDIYHIKHLEFYDSGLYRDSSR
eukprot:gene1669-2317_t